MNRRVLLLIIGSVLLPLGCGGNDGPTDLAVPLVLKPSEFCGDHPDAAIATFEDANLEAAIRAALSVGAQEPLTCGLVSGLTVLDASSAGITSLAGIQNLTSLTSLELSSNSITDISALSGLTSLTDLGLGFNSITDISALSGLTSLTVLGLSDNSITDISALSGLTSLAGLFLSNNPNLTEIQPLLDNTGLGAGDRVYLRSTSVSCTDVAALQAKGVTVESDCP
ncbi:MAG: leucine-rich repeat domain-containing protein [Gemmatimonadetes bacterium]|nr:leucine-rich repeat domain-containing protein [Gemmatimonadota bacterium]